MVSGGSGESETRLPCFGFSSLLLTVDMILEKQ